MTSIFSVPSKMPDGKIAYRQHPAENPMEALQKELERLRIENRNLEKLLAQRNQDVVNLINELDRQR